VATCVPSERNGVSGLNRTKIGFLVSAETYGTYNITGKEIIKEKCFNLRQLKLCKELRISQNDELDFCILRSRQLYELAGMEYL
jgi:hypothetical protein